MTTDETTTGGGSGADPAEPTLTPQEKAAQGLELTDADVAALEAPPAAAAAPAAAEPAAGDVAAATPLVDEPAPDAPDEEKQSYLERLEAHVEQVRERLFGPRELL